jgi:DNA-binding transcriptional LysR family regulator
MLPFNDRAFTAVCADRGAHRFAGMIARRESRLQEGFLIAQTLQREKPLYEESFVIATRIGYPFSRDPTFNRYCQMQHLVVSLTGDPHGLFDDLLAGLGRSRRVAVTVPNFMQAMMLIAETDLVAALPSRLAATHAERLGLTLFEPPLPRGSYKIRAIAANGCCRQSRSWQAFD